MAFVPKTEEEITLIRLEIRDLTGMLVSKKCVPALADLDYRPKITTDVSKYTW